MKEAPLETFIAFKSTTPIFFSIIDYVLLGRELPKIKSVMSMIGITLGAIYYVFCPTRRLMRYASFLSFSRVWKAFAKDTINRTK